MREYIKNLHQKMKELDQIKIPEKQTVDETEIVLEPEKQTKEDQLEEEKVEGDQVAEEENTNKEQEDEINDKPINNNITLEVVESA